MIRTEPAVLAARLLGLNSKLYPNNMQHKLNKDFTPFMQRLCRVHQIEQVKEKLCWSCWQGGSDVTLASIQS